MMFVRTRQEMAQYINDRMNKTYSELSEDQRLEYESSLTKVYLIEAHLSSDTPHDKIFIFLKENLSLLKKEHNWTIDLRETEESNFYAAFLKRKKDLITFYIDASDARFWLIHSMDKSKLIDPLIEKIAIGNQDLDRAWIPVQLLENTTKLGSLRGLGLDYDRRKIPDIDFETPKAPVESLKMQLWGNRSSKVLQILREEGAFPHETTLSKVKVKFWVDTNNSSDFSIDDIKYDGKITARGTSFQSHITLVSDLFRKYSGKIKEIEQQLSISFEEEQQRISISGSPINIIFENPISDLDLFCESVFSSSNPFRLWGVPIKLNEKYVRVSGIDLHVGKRIDFEITPEFMRIYLPSESCGNSIVRIFTNLQHYYDAKIDAQDGDGKSLFEF